MGNYLINPTTLYFTYENFYCFFASG